MVTQRINGIKNYFSHWEPLHELSLVKGIVWNEYLCYGCIFKERTHARKMLSRIRQYDNRSKYRIEVILSSELEKSKKIVSEMLAGLKNNE